MIGSTFITLKARSATDNKNGTFTLELIGEVLPAETQKVLEKLFPNLLEAANNLLNKEALLSAIAKDSEIAAQEEKVTKGRPKWMDEQAAAATK